MKFEVELEKFSGPLQLLLDLIEKQELPITEISLAKVTEDYLSYVESEKVPAEELADFLVVATKLLLIKSRAILPTPDALEEGDESSLALQLELYKEFVNASKNIENLFQSSVYLFAREKVSKPKAVEFIPPQDVDSKALRDSFRGLLKKLEPFFALQQESIKRVVSVQHRIQEIRDAILERSRITFRDVIKGAQTKVDVVVSFLALLELVKQKIVHASQNDTFTDINISHID